MRGLGCFPNRFQTGRLLRSALIASLSAACVVGLGAGSALAFDADSDSIGDEADAFPCNAQSAAVVFAPSQGDFSMTMFEDQWPGDSDLDFNDAVIASNYIFELAADGRVRSLRATYNVLALGGDFNNGLGLRLAGIRTSAVGSIRQTISGQPTAQLQPQPSDPDNLTVRLLPNMRALFNGQPGPINSIPGLPTVTGNALELEITFATPQTLDMGQAPFDLYIFRTEAPTHEIHRPQFPGTAEMDQALFGTGNDQSSLSRHFVDGSGLPYALSFPVLRPWAREGEAIHHLYPNIVQFAASGGTQAQDFYSNGVDLSFAYAWQVQEEQLPGAQAGAWAPPVTPSFIGPSSIPSDTGCVDAWGLSVTYGTGRDTFGYDSAMDGSGNVLITGYTTHSLTGNTNQGQQDVFVAKYNRSTGALVWSKLFGAAGSEAGRAVVTDSAGNIYVVGETRSSFGGQTNAGQYDAFLTKLDPAGNVLWTRLLGGSGYDRGLGVALDASGAVYICGGSDSTNLPGASYTDNAAGSFVAKYDTSGTRLWTQQFRTDPGAPANYSYGNALTVDSSGNVLLVGSERRFNQSPSAAENSYVAKLSGADGTLVWVNHLGDYGYYNGSSDYRFSHGLSVGTDSSGAAYIAGTWEAGSRVSSWGGLTRTAGDRSADMTLTKVDTAGALVWERSVGSSGSGADYAQAVKLDASGNVFLTGYSSGAIGGASQGGYDYVVARYDGAGNRAWIVQQGWSGDDAGFGLSLDTASGVAYVVGNSGNVAGVPVAYQTSYFGFIAQHSLSTGARIAFNPTVDTTLVSVGCRAVKALQPGAASGVYTIDADGPGAGLPFDVYCDMTTDGGGWTRVIQAQNDAAGYAVKSTGEVTPRALLNASATGYAKLSDAVIRQLALGGQGEYMMTARNVTSVYILRASPAEWQSYASDGWTNLRYDSKAANGVWSNDVCDGHWNNRGFSSISDSPYAWGGCPVIYAGTPQYLANYHIWYGEIAVGAPFFVYIR